MTEPVIKLYEYLIAGYSEKEPSSFEPHVPTRQGECGLVGTREHHKKLEKGLNKFPVVRSGDPIDTGGGATTDPLADAGASPFSLARYRDRYAS